MAGADQLPLPDGSATTFMVQGTNVSRIQGRLQQTLLSDGSASQRLRSAFPEGLSSDAIDTELSILSGHVQTAAENMGGAGTHIWDVGAAFETCESTIEGLQTEWDEVDTWFNNSLDQINTDPYYTDPANQRDKAEAIESIDLQRESRREDMKDRYDTALDTLGESMSTAASKLTELTDGFVPAAQQGSATDIAAAMTAGTTISDGSRRDHVADEQAEDAEELLEQAENGDQEAAQEFVDTYGDLVDDPYFATALMERLGTDGLNQASMQIMEFIDTGEGYPELQQQYRDLFGVLGGAYTTSAGDLSGMDPSTREDTETWRDQWLEDLQTSGREGYNPVTGEPYEEGMDGTVMYGYDIQSQLLAAGLAGDPNASVARDYMETVGVDMVEWDQWLTETYPHRSNYSHMGNSMYDFGESPLGDLHPTDPRRDPLHNLLQAAGRSEEATYGLLLEDIPAGDGQTQSIMEYYLHGRSDASNGMVMGMTDFGTTMGDVLESYSLDNTDEESVELAQQAIVGYNDAIAGSEPLDGSTAQTRAGLSMSALRPAMGTVMATYIDDLHTAFDGQATGDGVGQGDGGTYDITFSNGTLNNLHHTFGDLGYDRPDQIVRPGDDGSVVGDPDNPPALQRILNASYAHTNNGMYEALSDGNMDAAQDAFGNGSYFDAFVMESLSNENGDNAGALDQYNQYMQDLANEGLGLVPFDDIPVVGGAVDKGIDWAKDPVLEAMFDTGNEDASRVQSAEWQQAQNEMVNDRFYSAVAAAGTYEGSPSFTEWETASERDLGPDEQFWNEDGSVIPYDQMTPEQRDQFVDYLNDSENGAGGQYGSMTNDAEGRMNDARTRAANDNQADGG
ncbi:hypothetical protein ACPYO6_03360 [Georgenia sp. Z1344]|uniref:hypothetical protein n=1 Tax=Georgenia sp. Z1344 TaxID=3416706 RepID=UPI003CFAF67A